MLDFPIGKCGSSVLQEALLAQKQWHARKLIFKNPNLTQHETLIRELRAPQ